MANLRKLAAIDIVFLGRKVVVAEYTCGVLLCAALGIFVLIKDGSLWQLALGMYFISLAINYVPMLTYAVSIATVDAARTMMGDELEDKRKAMAKYRRQSVLLLVPFLVAILAVSSRDQH
jgi:hypothetical protein